MSSGTFLVLSTCFPQGMFASVCGLCAYVDCFLNTFAQIRVQPAPETLFREFVGTQLYHPVSASMWAPLAALQRLTIEVDEGARPPEAALTGRLQS